MVSVCFYFQVHQPYRLRTYNVFDIGHNHDYWNEERNKKELLKIREKCYLPTNSIIYDLIKKHRNFKVAYSISGVLLDQLEQYHPDVLESFKKLVRTGNVELLNETYYHSLAFLYSKQEFKKQVLMHKNKIKNVFGISPRVFRNTELLYNNDVANFVQGMGYKGILAEGADHILGWRSPNFVYTPKTANSIKLLLKNYRLSDDIAFRFSNKGWEGHPLTAPKFAEWVNEANGNGNVVNLFMDYETFGEHQWEDTGIFDFLNQLPSEILKHPDNNFKTPSEVMDDYPSVAELDIHHVVSWADLERDLSAWLGNKMQKEAIKTLYDMEKDVLRTRNRELITDWRKLQTSDHFYYMCTKWFSDGDVHKYFNPYDSPYDAFISFMNIMNDMKIRIKQAKRIPEKQK